jgi:hypothetical protein|tara:strand:+ start:1704 stop:2948 length:1245 start_codon:yes stop_codon:yes gene_type:complete
MSSQGAAGSGIKTTGFDIAKKANVSQGYNVNNISGVYVAEVMNDADNQHNGRITVKIPELGSTSERIILLTTPFGGNTSIKESADDPTLYGEKSTSVSGSPKTYGMWPQPPAIGSNILVAFVGSMEQGFMLGFIPPRDRNATMGGNASNMGYDGKGGKILARTSESNLNDNLDADTRPADPTSVAHLNEAGLADDYVRGHSQSSARRESPSNVFGITSKGGHTLSLDDGAEDGSSDNIRIKTRGGHTILLDDTNGFIFITNKLGNSWIEMDAEGQVDIYSKGGVSVATDGDYNVHAKGSINMQADQGVNIKATGTEGVKLQSTTGTIDFHSAIDINSSALKEINMTSVNNMYIQGSRVDINGPTPKAAVETTKQSHMTNTSITESVASRVPEHHPWKGASTTQESQNLGLGDTA